MMKTCWHRIRYPLTELAVLSLSGCDWVLFNSKGAVGIAQRDLIILCIALMMIVVVPAIVCKRLYGRLPVWQVMFGIWRSRIRLQSYIRPVMQTEVCWP